MHVYKEEWEREIFVKNLSKLAWIEGGRERKKISQNSLLIHVFQGEGERENLSKFALSVT